ncbi:MAG: cytochrome b [bacterium JZ-2024 1]
MKFFERLADALEERYKLRSHFRAHLSGYMVPANLTIWHCLGSVLIFLLVTQLLTGILLLVYYVPDSSRAFESVMRISNEIPYGWYIRRLHASAANLFIFVLFLHMLSTLVMGSYKKPRELQWMTGILLLGAGFGAALSGYLLPWSQLSYWATTVATNSLENLPLFGEGLANWLRGGDSVTGETLGRFFALHVWVFPLLFLVLVSAHIFLLRQTGIAPVPWATEKTGKIPFYPHFVLEDLETIYYFFAVLMVLIFLYPQWSFPPEAWEPANPLSTPLHIKPEWYFLANYQFLKIVPSEKLGILLQVLAGVLLFFLPYLDRSPERNPLKRPVFLFLVVLGVCAFIGLTIWGKLS